MPDPDPNHPVQAETASEHDLMLTREVSNLYRFASSESTIAFLREQGVVPVYRGRTFLWRRKDIQVLLTKMPSTTIPA